MSYSFFDNVLFSIGGTEGSEGNDLIINLFGHGEIDSAGGNDVIIDLFWNSVTATGGSGYDVLSLGRGNDTAIYNIADNMDNDGHSFLGTDFDVYYGGGGTDTLTIDFAGSMLSASAAAEIEALFYANVGGIVDLRDVGLDLVVKGFENLDLQNVPDDLMVFARAWTDLGVIDGVYNPNEDAMIAELVDTNDDGVVSVGDTIMMGTYPTNFDASTPRGTFGMTEHTINLIVEATDALINVSSANGTNIFIFADESETGGAGVIADAYIELGSSDELVIGDTLISPTNSTDGISVEVGSVTGPVPSLPSTPVNIQQLSVGDDAFLNVDIDLMTGV